MDINLLLELIKSGEGEKVEFKEGFSNNIREEIAAFANTDGGYIIIGVNDEGRIVGIKKDEKEIIDKIKRRITEIYPMPKILIHTFSIDKKKLICIEVKKSNKIHMVGGKFYIRVGSSLRPLTIEELVEKLNENLTFSFDSLISKVSVKEVNKKYVNMYFKIREERRGVVYKGGVIENLRRINAVKKKNRKLFLTNAGLLFFHENPQKYIPNALLRIVHFVGEDFGEYSDDVFINGPVWMQVDKAMEYLNKNIKIYGGTVIGTKRIERREYPLRALREAITNALIHRNYFLPSHVQVFIFSNRIEIRNPGSIPEGVDLNNPIHLPRNPLLASYMYDLGYIEKYGSGIKMIREECEKHGMVKVVFEKRPYFTKVTFIKEKKYFLSKTEEKILNILYGNELRSSEISQRAKLSKPTVLKILSGLIKKGFVEKIEKGPFTKYKIKDTL